MSAPEYCGVAAPPFVSCQMLEDGPAAVSPRSVAVPGRPGAVLLGGDLAPKRVRMRLFLDARTGQDQARLSEARRALDAWLAHPEGGRLAVPTGPGLAYEDAVLTDAGSWDAFRDEGAITLSFTCFDPIAYGAAHELAGKGGDNYGSIGGTWPTRPRFEIVAESGSAVEARDRMGGSYVRLEREFKGGEEVSIDCAGARCAVNGVDASAAVSLGSTFFRLGPAGFQVAVTGALSWRMLWDERWA